MFGCAVFQGNSGRDVTTIRKWTGRESRALRKAMRLSQRDFANDLGISGKSVSNWEARGADLVQRPESQAILDTKLRQVSDEVRERFELILGSAPEDDPAERNANDVPGSTDKSSSVIPVHPLTLNLAPDPDLYERITRVVEKSARVDSSVVNWMERCLAEHRRVEDSTGAKPLVSIVRSQLSAVAEMAREARGPLSNSVVDLAAQYAQFMAWLCNDLQDKAAALAWYDRAHDWAIEAGDANMAATTLSMKAHLAWSTGDATRCVRLGEAARWNDSRTSLGVQGMSSQMIARGHALDADTGQAHRSIDEAETLIKAAAEHPEDEPTWMYFYGETWFTLQRGMIETELAERSAGDARYAITLLGKALKDLPKSYRRDRAWYGTMLVRAHAAANDYDAAAGTGLKFANDAIAVNSYAASDLEGISTRLTRLGVREARDLADVLSETRS